MNLFKKIKILGIDDSESHHLLCDSIFNEGFFGRFSYTGIDGIGACNGIKPNDYDVILIDWDFRTTPNNINGFTIRNRIMDEFHYKGNIIFVTGHKHIVKELRETGHLAIQKVFDPKQITEFIVEVVGNKKPDVKTYIAKLEDISNYSPKPLLK